MNADVRPYREEHWPALRQLLAEQWRADLPLLDKQLFDWLYRGYGPLAGDASGDRPSRLVFLRDKLVGFYGAIAGVYRLPGRPAVVPGLAMALWVVHKEFRNVGLGIFLLRGLEAQTPITLTLGANPDTIRYLTGCGYLHLPALHRWVAPLEADGYRSLCSRPVDEPAIRRWCDGVERAEPIEPRAMSAAELAERWRRLAPNDCLTLDRVPDFFQWRYLDSPQFRYLAFPGPGGSLAIGRIEGVIDPQDSSRNCGSVFRIIELWLSEADPPFVPGLLAWARQSGAAAADFQCSNRRLANPLEAAGMRLQSLAPQTSLAQLFQPFRPDAAPINALWRVGGDCGGPPPAEDTWLLKSDGDMDRPNVTRKLE